MNTPYFPLLLTPRKNKMINRKNNLQFITIYNFQKDGSQDY